MVTYVTDFGGDASPVTAPLATMHAAPSWRAVFASFQVFNFRLSFIGGLRTFDLIWTMTRGGPGFTTDVITSTIYKQYQAGFYGLSTAGNVVLFAGVAILVYPMMRFFSSKEIEL